jgi:hypothetical protein
MLKLTLVDMSSESVGLLSSPDRSTSPSLTDPIVSDCCTTNQIFNHFNSITSQRSPGKRQLTIEESLITTNDPKRLCNRFVIRLIIY